MIFNETSEGAGEDRSTRSEHLNASCHWKKFEVCGMSKFYFTTNRTNTIPKQCDLNTVTIWQTRIISGTDVKVRIINFSATVPLHLEVNSRTQKSKQCEVTLKSSIEKLSKTLTNLKQMKNSCKIIQGSKIRYSMTSLLRLSMQYKAHFQHPFTAFHKPKTIAKQGINPVEVILLSDVWCDKINPCISRELLLHQMFTCLLEVQW